MDRKRVKRIFYTLVGIAFGFAVICLLAYCGMIPDTALDAVADTYAILSALTLAGAIWPSSYAWLNPKTKKDKKPKEYRKILKDYWKDFRRLCNEEEKENHKEENPKDEQKQ